MFFWGLMHFNFVSIVEKVSLPIFSIKEMVRFFQKIWYTSTKLHDVT